jgi:hypothetical protein
MEKTILSYIVCMTLAHSRVPSHHGPHQNCVHNQGGGGMRLGVPNLVINLD